MLMTEPPPQLHTLLWVWFSNTDDHLGLGLKLSPLYSFMYLWLKVICWLLIPKHPTSAPSPSLSFWTLIDISMSKVQFPVFLRKPTCPMGFSRSANSIQSSNWSGEKWLMWQMSSLPFLHSHSCSPALPLNCIQLNTFYPSFLGSHSSTWSSNLFVETS